MNNYSIDIYMSRESVFRHWKDIETSNVDNFNFSLWKKIQLHLPSYALMRERSWQSLLSFFLSLFFFLSLSTSPSLSLSLSFSFFLPSSLFLPLAISYTHSLMNIYDTLHLLQTKRYYDQINKHLQSTYCYKL